MLQEEILHEVNKLDDIPALKDKYLCYEKFHTYYDRNVVLFESGNADELFRILQENFPNGAFIKPLSASGGFGVERVSKDNMTKDAIVNLNKRLNNGIDGHGKFVIEEIVNSDERISELNTSSLNTVRIITILDKKKEPHILGQFIRAGRDGKIVDNAASGGIICRLSDDGIIQMCIDENGNEYIRHPDTGKMLVGFQVPRWDEAVRLARELAQRVPTIRFCGWDLALTRNGWIMMEGNEASEFIGIQIFGIGCKQIVNRYM